MSEKESLPRESAPAATPGEPVIEVRNLETYFGDRHILKDVGFDILK